MKTIIFDVMCGDKFIMQYSYRWCPAFPINFEEVLKEIIKRPTLKGYSISARKTNTPGCKYSIWTNMDYVSGRGFAEPTLAMGKEMLERFPMTQETLYDRKFYLPYAIVSQKGYGDKFAELGVRWISNEYEVRMTLKIDDLLREEFFNVKRRCPVDSEVSTYTSIHTSHLIGKDFIPVHDFKKGHLKYYGGVRLLLDKEEISRIIEFIKIRG